MKCEDARRMARNLVKQRNAQGDSIFAPGIHMLTKMQAALVAGYAARPASYRTVSLDAVTPRVVSIHYGAGR